MKKLKLKKILLNELLTLREMIDKDLLLQDFCICVGVSICLSKSYKNIKDNKLDKIKKSILKILKKVFKSWSKFSGNINYPISINGENEFSTYIYYFENSKLWNKTTVYGQLRYELLDFVIDYLIEDIGNKLIKH